MRDSAAQVVHEQALAHPVRSVPQKLDRPLADRSRSSIGNLAHIFSKVLRGAMRKRWTRSAERTRICKDSFDSRMACSPFGRAMNPACCDAPPRGRSCSSPTILRAQVAVATQTGMRPGAEPMA